MGFIWYFDIYINSLWLTMAFAVAHIFDGQAQRKGDGMARKEDVFLDLIFIFQLFIFMVLKIAASWLKKINNGW
ncbi:hypothetical protein [Aeromonas allosaccharophila]|uniref:hypothetical protein n=1 Tax=Aeromonas allosaccharophila TaxID=656 RepID=UPI001B5C2BFC|nr:hypothetical protein [Aeromonas allosaccharophila]MBP8218750.1 hypothetical protein [Aeromonas sp.]